MTSTVHERRPGSSPWRILGWAAAAAVLLIPLVAMQFTSEVNWTAVDFLFAGVMLAIVGTLAELTVRRTASKWYRAGAGIAVGTAFLLMWINGAVGIIGDEGNPANLMFLGVILVAVAGSIVARAEAGRMALAMAVAAGAQALVGLVVFAYGLGASEPPGLAGVLALIGLFTLSWLASAWLFRRAARTGD